MAFKLEVIRGSTTYTLSDPGNASVPFSIEEADLGGASIRNIEESGPYQDGATHLDERLEPDTITLRINVVGSSASALDGHRDTLNTMFKPVRGVPITLKLTRDDGVVRQLDTRRTGRLAIPLVTQNRPGNLHRAVVQLRAAHPAWYNPTQGTASFTPPASEWWLAQGNIGSANVVAHVENPTQGQAWSYSGSIAAGSAYSVFFRSGSAVPGSGTEVFAYSYEDSGAKRKDFFGQIGAEPFYLRDDANVINETGYIGNIAMSSGTANYIVTHNGGTMSVYRDNVLLGTVGGSPAALRGTASGGTARWRSRYDNNSNTYWTPALPYAAVYREALSFTQRAALGSATLVGSAYNTNIVYDGDFDSYPIITITGPISNPVITNTTTGDTLNFTGGTVGTSEVWTIDTRYGYKSALFGTTSIEQYLSTDSDLSTFRLVAAPLATGGTNTILVQGSDAGTAALISIAYTKYYMSY